jgi:hypothetical protein
VVEVVGLLFFIVGYTFGLLNVSGAMSVMFLSFGTGFLLSISSVLLEEVAFQTYPHKKHLWTLFLGAFVENFGFHQLMSIWRLEGIIKWLMRADASWGAMTRNTSWQAAPASTPAADLSKLKDKPETGGVKVKEKQAV